MYTGFMAIGDIGGLAVFLYLVWRYAMFVVGFLVVNDSRSLACGSTSASEAAERQPILRNNNNNNSSAAAAEEE